MSPQTDRLDCSIVTPTSASWLTTPSRTGTSGPRLRRFASSAPQRKDHAQEHPLPLVPRQQPIQQSVASSDDLAGHQNDRVHEPLELHPQQTSLLSAMNLLVPRVLRNRQR